MREHTPSKPTDTRILAGGPDRLSADPIQLSPGENLGLMAIRLMASIQIHTAVFRPREAVERPRSLATVGCRSVASIALAARWQTLPLPSRRAPPAPEHRLSYTQFFRAQSFHPHSPAP